MNFTEDIYCIERVIGGETQAYSFLVEKYKKQAYTFALKLVKIPEDAEEVAHDAFVKAFQSLRSFRQESKFSTWLYKIVYNLSMSRLRKKQIDIRSLDDVNQNAWQFPQSDNLFNTLSEQEQSLIVRSAVDKLPDDEKSVVTLYYLNDCAVKDIMEITGFSEANVKIKLFRARKRLLDMLKHLYSDYYI